MSSRCLTELPVAALILLTACGHHRRDEEAIAPVGPGGPFAPAGALVPAGGSLPSQPDPRAKRYYDNAAAVIEGRQLYNAMNCVGCHFNGGGGIGPPLMDDKWIYGGRLDQIYDTIYHGRANGMPAWGGKLQDDQIWKIATYVRSMSLPATLAANNGGTPSQNPAPVPAAADAHDGWHLPK